MDLEEDEISENNLLKNLRINFTNKIALYTKITNRKRIYLKIQTVDFRNLNLTFKIASFQ